MSDHSKIEWTDATWNPIRARNRATGKIGWHCEHVTPGCENCYAESFNRRLGTGLPYKPGHRKDIEIFLDKKVLTAPLRWRRPRMIFTGSMTDPFADFVKDEWLDRIVRTMGACDDLGMHHAFQILTKRADRMREYMDSDRAYRAWNGPRLATEAWPPRNLWLGVSAERQQEADERIPLLLKTQAAVRFISAEPLLGPIDLTRVKTSKRHPLLNAFTGQGLWGQIESDARLNWVIVGGESGKNARPMYPDWACSLRDQCVASGVPFFFKQWGGTNKKAAGRTLDSREWNEFPQRPGDRTGGKQERSASLNRSDAPA